MCRLERGPAEEGVGGGRGVSVQTTEEVRRREEHGGKREWIDMRGEGQQWRPRLIKERLLDHASDVCLSGPAEVAHWDILRATL